MAMQAYGPTACCSAATTPFEQMAWIKQYVIDEGAADVVFANVLPGLLP